jgi:hypothetical protein
MKEERKKERIQTNKPVYLDVEEDEEREGEETEEEEPAPAVVH